MSEHIPDDSWIDWYAVIVLLAVALCLVRTNQLHNRHQDRIVHASSIEKR